MEADEKFLFALIRASFNQRRKTLANALSHGLQNGAYAVNREMVQEALREMGLPESVRGEALAGAVRQACKKVRQYAKILIAFMLENCVYSRHRSQQHIVCRKAIRIVNGTRNCSE